MNTWKTHFSVHFNSITEAPVFDEEKQTSYMNAIKVYFQIKYPKPMRIFDYITATQAVNESISAWTRRVEGLAIAAEAQTPLSTSLFTADVFVTS